MDEIERGKDARLQKWQKRLEDALPGTPSYSSALGMVRQLTKPPSAGIDLYAGAGSTARAYNYPTQSDHIHFAFDGFPDKHGSLKHLAPLGEKWEAISVAEQLEPIRYTQAEARVASQGRMYVAPVGKQAAGWPEGWLELGYTEEGYAFSADVGPLTEVTTETKLLKALGFKSDDIVSIDARTEQLRAGKLELALEMIARDYPEGITDMLTHNATADELEQAALNLAAQAAAIRAFDATEPQGDEPTISFTHTYNDQPGGYGTNRDTKAYTFVGFKCNGEGGTDKWYLTGPKAAGRAYTWRELGANFRAIAEGNFLIVTKWGAAK